MLAGGAQVQADVQRDLIVAAAPGVQALTGVTDAGGQRLLDEGVDVLGVGVDLQLAGSQIIRASKRMEELKSFTRLSTALLARPCQSWGISFTSVF